MAELRAYLGRARHSVRADDWQRAARPIGMGSKPLFNCDTKTYAMTNKNGDDWFTTFLSAAILVLRDFDRQSAGTLEMSGAKVNNTGQRRRPGFAGTRFVQGKLKR